jgi:dTDP-L-rhamnose 4-epimerase
MTETILITGGAGFVGRHLARALLERGHRVRALDSLIAQVHPTASVRPSSIPRSS